MYISQGSVWGFSAIKNVSQNHTSKATSEDSDELVHQKLLMAACQLIYAKSGLITHYLLAHLNKENGCTLISFYSSLDNCICK